MANAKSTAPVRQSYFQFASDVLAGIGAKPTKANLAFFAAWYRAEGTKAGFNPLATTQPGPVGTSNFNTHNVKNYPTYQDGVNATVQTLRNGNYNGLVNSFQQGNVNPVDIAQKNSSELDTWGSGGAAVTNIAKQITGTQGSSSSHSFWGDVWGGITAPFDNGKPNGIFSMAPILGDPIPTPSAGTIAHPIRAAQQGVDQAAISVGMYALYGLTLLAGLLLILTGFLLIGADIGLAVFERSTTVQKARKITRIPAQRKQAQGVKEYKARSYKKPAKDTTPELTAQQERRNAINERARNAKQDKDIPF